MGNPTKELILNQIDFREYYQTELNDLGKINKEDGWTEHILCPFHEEKTPSFGVNVTTGQFKCFGCDTKGDIFAFHMEKYGVDFETALDALAKIAGLTQVRFVHPELGVPVKNYGYRDTDGTILYFVCRFEPKEFRPCSLNEKGQIIWRVKGIKPVPYRLPDFADAEMIIICEGEKDADTMRQLGFIATCKPNWTGDWNPDFAEYFNGKNVVILQDADEAGQKKALDAAKHISGADDTAVIVLPPFSDKPKYDVTDWINDGHTKEELQILIDQASFWEPPREKTLADFILPLADLVKMDIPERESIVEPFIKTQSLSMCYAKRGTGKTYFSMELALSVAKGEQFFVWDVPSARRVLFIDGEMPLIDLKTRLIYLARGHIPDTLDILPSELLWTEDCPLNLNNAADQKRINTMLADLEKADRRPELIIIDNLSSMSAGTEENSNSELDSLLQWLITLRHRGFAIVLIHHSGKNGEQRGASRREDLLDTSIKLVEPTPGAMPATGAKFQIEFTKLRGAKPDPDKIGVELGPSIDGCGYGEWTFDRRMQLAPMEQVLTLIRDESPATQEELAGLMGVSQPAVSRHVTTARSRGYLPKRGLILTREGKQFIDEKVPF